MTRYVLHFMIGLIGMVAGFYASHFCQHVRHQIIVGVALVVLETMITIPLVG